MADKNDRKLFNINYLINYLYIKLTGEPWGTKIKPAPHWSCLKLFGGDLDIEDFRNSSENGKVYTMVEYPMYVSRDYIEEVDIANVKNANAKLFDDNAFAHVMKLDDQRINDAKLRLSQIEKTTITTGNTIDKFIKMS
jgi:hypothetical protein